MKAFPHHLAQAVYDFRIFPVYRPTSCTPYFLNCSPSHFLTIIQRILDNNNCFWSADCLLLPGEKNHCSNSQSFHTISFIACFECASIDLLLFALDRLTTTILFVFPRPPTTQPLNRSSIEDWPTKDDGWQTFFSFICAHTCADSTIDGYFPFTLARSP